MVNQEKATPPVGDTIKRLALIGVLVSAALNSIGQLLFKAARQFNPDASLFDLFLIPQTWVAFFIYGLSAVIWLWVLSRAPLSFAYPILAITFPIVVALSAFFFGEVVTVTRWVGVGIIVLGVSLLART